MERTLRALLIGSLCVGAAACAGTVKNMRAVENVNTAVGPNEAIDHLPEAVGHGLHAVQSSVFEVSDNRPATLVGIVAAKKKLAYRTTPGPHTFMIIRESADFMYAELQPGRTYHAIAQVRMGVGKARFSLEPVHAWDSWGPLPVPGRFELGGDQPGFAAMGAGEFRRHREQAGRVLRQVDAEASRGTPHLASGRRAEPGGNRPLRLLMPFARLPASSLQRSSTGNISRSFASLDCRFSSTMVSSPRTSR